MSESEVRFCETVAEHRRPLGRSTVVIRCAFCGVETEARAWSLAGSGKRCDCGAVLTTQGIGMASARRKREVPA